MADTLVVIRSGATDYEVQGPIRDNLRRPMKMFEGTYATPAYLDAPMICGDCGSRTPLDEMASKKRCKKCHAKQRAEWYQANKAECNARKRRWRQRNPEKVAEHRRRYYLKTGR